MTLIKNNIGTAQFNFTDFETSYQLDIQLGFFNSNFETSEKLTEEYRSQSYFE